MEHYEDRIMVASSNYFKSIIFLELSIKHQAEDDLISSIIESYYSIFHLSVSRIKLFKKYNFDPSKELCDPNDPNAYKSTHKSTQKQINELVQDSVLNESFLSLLKRLEKKRTYVNYGPRLSNNNGEYTFDTCSYPELKNEMSSEISYIKKAFKEYVKSIKSINESTFLFMSNYKDFYFDQVFQNLKFCSASIIASAKIFHESLYFFHKNC